MRRDDNGFKVEHGIPGAGLAPVWIREDREYWFPAHAYPNGGMLPTRVYIWPLAWQSFLLACLSAAASAVFRGFVARRRRAKGGCSYCAYPVTSGRCPECGKFRERRAPGRTNDGGGCN